MMYTWNFNVVWNNGDALGVAFVTTVWISLLSIALGSMMGILLGVGSLAPYGAVRWLSRLGIEFFLALPALVLLVWLYYSLPILVPGLVLGSMTVAVLGLGLSLSAFVAEIVRGGVNAVPAGQLEAAYLTGMTPLQAARYILVPQVIRKSWPALMGQFITTYKFSTLASVIAVPEILHRTNSVIAQTYRPLELYSAVALLFVLTVMPMNLLLRRVQNVSRLGGTETL